MRIVERYSHLNGWEFLLVHRPHLWDEVQNVIASVDAELCKTKESMERGKVGTLLYSPIAMNTDFKSRFGALGWSESRTAYWVTANAELIRKTLNLDTQEQKRVIEESGATPIYSYNQTDYVKERVAVEVQFGKYSFVAYDLFVKHMAFYVGDKIDVGVEILPMKSLSSNMSSGISYYEGELYNLVRQGRGVPAVPLVLLGVDV